MKRLALVVLCALALLPAAAAARVRARAATSSRVPTSKPPRIKLLKRTRYASPGYIFIAPKKKVTQGGPLILDNRGRVVWFMPVDERGVTDFRVQRYRGKPVLTWWRGKSADDKRLGAYSIYDKSYRLSNASAPGHGLSGDMHEFTITPRNTALITLSHVRAGEDPQGARGGVPGDRHQDRDASSSSGTASATSR